MSWEMFEKTASIPGALEWNIVVLYFDLVYPDESISGIVEDGD